jgi:Cof subfamily protein (haloacid dehalogenase superfamily)
MIKLIATDMDGTLLDSNRRLPKDFYEVLSNIRKKDIIFIAASGRSYINLREQFKGHEDEISYICDNGANIMVDNKSIYRNAMDKKIVNQVIKHCESLKETHVILCGTKGFYYNPIPKKEYEKEILAYYIQESNVLDNLYSVNDDIFKIAIYDGKIAKDNSYKKINAMFNKDLSVTISGNYWVDIMNKGINKGKAVEILQKKYGITKEETMVFGDFYNDIEMLNRAKYSFAVENASDEIKKHCNYIAKSNDNNGVVNAIKEYVYKMFNIN